MQEKLTQKELLTMQPNEERVLFLPSELARHSAMVVASKTSKLYPREDVKRYACKSGKIEEEGHYPLIITAIANE